MPVRQLNLKNGENDVKVVEIDTDAVIGYGGFGSIIPIPSETGFVVKRVEFNPPQPLGAAPGFVAHIKTTRQRLLSIHEEERTRERPRIFILHSIEEIVDQALSTHWCFDLDKSLITAVWYRQRVAPGQSLLDRFHQLPPPHPDVRRRIALSVVARMRTLRRADLVHLDCVADNIFVDDTGRVTLIDLDGCGIVRRHRGATPADQWDHRPLTLGHLTVVRPPPWYPQVGIEAGPKTGNFLFAERWVLLDTLIRILSWNRLSVLSWLDNDVRTKLVGGYRYIRGRIETDGATGHIWDATNWTTCFGAVLTELKNSIPSLPPYVVPAEYPQSLGKFIKLAQEAVFNPRALTSKDVAFYDVYRDWLSP